MPRSGNTTQYSTFAKKDMPYRPIGSTLFLLFLNLYVGYEISKVTDIWIQALISCHFMSTGHIQVMQTGAHLYPKNKGHVSYHNPHPMHESRLSITNTCHLETKAGVQGERTQRNEYQKTCVILVCMCVYLTKHGVVG